MMKAALLHGESSPFVFRKQSFERVKAVLLAAEKAAFAKQPLGHRPPSSAKCGQLAKYQ